VWSAVAQLRDGGTTVLLVTHELDEAEALCERVVAMRSGRVLDTGTPAELVGRHAGAAVVSFTGGADALPELRALPGVQEGSYAAGRVSVAGERQSIAYIGAWLVGRRPDRSSPVTTLDHAPDRAGVVARRPRSAVRRLIGAEMKLMVRDLLTLTFVFMFPIVTMLIIGGSFGSDPDPAFGGRDPSAWYVASYFTVVIGATGLIMLPVHIASCRERGVLRRFAASAFPRWSFALAQLVVGLTTIVLGDALLLAVAAPVYGVPGVQDWGRVAAGVAAGSVAFVSIVVLLGTLLPSARSAQAIGLLLFFPSFLI